MTPKINIGDHVEICHDPAEKPTQESWNEYIGATGVVVEIGDRDDGYGNGSCGVILDDDIALGYHEDVHWFRCYELKRL
jgi:hypothetical protein